MSKSAVKTAPPLDPDAPFWLRLQERLTYLRNRRWVQISAVLLLVALAVWGFFYVRSLLPRTPAQLLRDRTTTLRASAELQEATAKLELIRAMIVAGRQPAGVERYRNILANDLERTLEAAPKPLRENWPGIERQLDELQAALNEGSEEALTSLNSLKAALQRLTLSS
jgi:hypothetical protein